MEVQVKSMLKESEQSICLLPQDIINSLHLSKEKLYNIHFGQLYKHALIDLVGNQENCMIVSQKLFNELLLVPDLTLNIRKEFDDIYLGPVVGIFINQYNFPLYEDGTAPKYHARASIAEHCYCYYFSIDNINWKENTIKGYTLSPVSNKWIYGLFPMPDVIYDRGVGFEEEQKPLVKEIRNNFKKNPNIHIINKRNYLGKEETYEKLSKYPEICCYLPKTIPYTNFNDVLIMLKQYDFIFLKYSFGSGGKQVVSIEQIENKYKLILYSGGLKELILNNTEELRTYVESYTEGRKFILQRGIRLLKYKDSVFDMRVLIIKNDKGKWMTVYNQARIAKSNFTITNYCAGGDVAYYENFYEDLSSSINKVKIPTYDEIGDTTIKLAEYIDKAFGSFGELGMDIAIDITGRLWFIEANTKPDKDLVEGLDDLEGILLQNLAIFQYARYLTAFNA